MRSPSILEITTGSCMLLFLLQSVTKLGWSPLDHNNVSRPIYRICWLLPLIIWRMNIYSREICIHSMLLNIYTPYIWSRFSLSVNHLNIWMPYIWVGSLSLSTILHSYIDINANLQCNIHHHRTHLQIPNWHQCQSSHIANNLPLWHWWKKCLLFSPFDIKDKGMSSSP